MARSRRERLVELLTPDACTGLDTSVFIYHFEANPDCVAQTTAILESVAAGERSAANSVVSLMDLTVPPRRLQSPSTAAEYEARLAHFPYLHLLDVTRPIARRAAMLRAQFRIGPADALIPATSVEGGASVMITNDRALRRLTPILDVILLDDFR
jgi:predicted nucleic acid-binding protein